MDIDRVHDLADRALALVQDQPPAASAAALATALGGLCQLFGIDPLDVYALIVRTRDKLAEAAAREDDGPPTPRRRPPP